MVHMIQWKARLEQVTLAATLALTVVSNHANAQTAPSEAATTSQNGAGKTALLRSIFDAKHVLSFGGTRQSTDAVISADADDFDAVSLTLDDLGVDSRDNSFFVEYRYRLKPRLSIFTGAYNFGGSGGLTNARDFTYDGVEFSTGSELEASLDIDAYILDILYSVYHRDNLEVMLGGGLHALDLSANIRGDVRLGDQMFESQTAATSLLAPVPNFRGSATWTPSERWAFTLVTGWLSANVDDYSGDFVYAHLRAAFRIKESLAISLGYQVTEVDVTEDRPRGDLSFDVRVQGPTLTLTYGF